MARPGVKAQLSARISMQLGERRLNGVGHYYSLLFICRSGGRDRESRLSLQTPLAPSQKAARGVFKRPVITSGARIKMDFSEGGPELAVLFWVPPPPPDAQHSPSIIMPAMENE